MDETGISLDWRDNLKISEIGTKAIKKEKVIVEKNKRII
jgi:hypothetical protein